MMLDRKSTTSEFLHSMFQKSHLDLVLEIELSSNDLLIDLARIGLGIAFVPDFCIPEDEKQLFILKLSETLPVRQLVVVHNENLPVSRLQSSLWICCRIKPKRVMSRSTTCRTWLFSFTFCSPQKSSMHCPIASLVHHLKMFPLSSETVPDILFLRTGHRGAG